MGSSAVLLAKRALVALVRSLALTYGVVVCCNRDSADQVVLGSFRKVALKAHPDHGGNTSDQAKMNEAREAWDQARRQKATAGRSKGLGQAKGKQGQSDKCLLLVVDVPTGKGRKEYRVQSQAAMLTYMGFDGGMDQWGRFCDFVQRALQRWGVKHWCATLETTKQGKPHAHLMLQFARSVDRTTAAFVFEDLRPNASPTDLCGEGLCRKRMQVSMDRGFYYVWADKEGTVSNDAGKPCVEGNYRPVWSDAKCPGSQHAPTTEPSFCNGWMVPRALPKPPAQTGSWSARAWPVGSDLPQSCLTLQGGFGLRSRSVPASGCSMRLSFWGPCCLPRPGTRTKCWERGQRNSGNRGS